jgi:hypothetical protein
LVTPVVSALDARSIDRRDRFLREDHSLSSKTDFHNSLRPAIVEPGKQR